MDDLQRVQMNDKGKATPGQVVIVTGRDDKFTLEMHLKKRKKKKKKKDNRLEAPNTESATPHSFQM